MANHVDPRDDPLGGPSPMERADALRQVCRAFQRFLGGRGAAPAIALEDEPYEIPRDGSVLLVIHHRSQPTFVKSYMVYCEPGDPLLESDYHSLDQFIRQFYSDQIELHGRRSVRPSRGFPPRPGARSNMDAALRYLDALEEESVGLQTELSAWIASPPLRKLEKIIWS
ncbi:MAG: hypothetical protein VKP70_05175 [Cyanobacteriota bacterium]|nr:hypothetical protein [Cyanobacteriota bacterium]